MPLPGRASPHTTYPTRHPNLTYNPLGSTSLLVSQAGFGCYRVDVSVPAHQDALRHALMRGVNLIDTSSNYADGGSEQLVGAVLGEMAAGGLLKREDVVVVSKVGYLQGQNYALSQSRKQAGNPFPDLVEYADGLEHCIHPEFLADQLTRSLERLKLETLDVYLLHNPEYFLGWAKKQGWPVADAQAEYYQRIRLALEQLEEEVASGRIGWYGISSNTFPSPAGQYDHTSLSKIWEIAETISPNHHCRVIQLPMNLYETGGATENNQPAGQTVLQFAHEKKIGVLINRPLNAFANGQLIRLADVWVDGQPNEARVSTMVDTLVDNEQVMHNEILPQMMLEPTMAQQLGQAFSMGQLLRDRWRGFGTYQRWQDVVRQYIVPRVQRAGQFLASRPDAPPPSHTWLDNYIGTLNHALTEIGFVYQAEAVTQVMSLKQRVMQADGEWGGGNALSQMAVRALRSTAGITTVLVGMRQQAYVDDVLLDLQLPVTVSGREASWNRLG